MGEEIEKEEKRKEKNYLVISLPWAMDGDDHRQLADLYTEVIFLEFQILPITP